MKKLGLALGAGAARGIAHVGFLQALEEEGIKPDFIAGCSMGSVVGAAYAEGISFERMKKAVFSLRLLDILTPAGRRGGLFGTSKMRKTIENVLGDYDFKDLPLPFKCVATDIVHRRPVVLDEGKVLDAVIASSCMPFLFSPVDRDGMRLVDGYVLERVPARVAKEMGADVVIAIDALGPNPLSTRNPVTVQMALELVDLLEGEQILSYKEKHKDKYDRWWEYDLGEMSQFDIRKVEFACEKGYQFGKVKAEEIKKLLE